MRIALMPSTFNLKHCWEEVFDRLDDPQDLLSLYNTCTAFQNILELDKWSWGFNLVFPHMAHHFSEKRTSFANKSCKISDDDWNDLLNYREVSKPWSKTIDGFLSSSSLNFRTTRESRQLKLIHDFDSIEGLEDFHKRFGTWKKNPFPGRTVLFSQLSFKGVPPDGDDFEELCVKSMIEYTTIRIPRMVQHFGVHIQTLLLNYVCPCMFTNCVIISETLKHLPNLKSLALPMAPPQFSIDLVMTYFLAHPIPQLASLEHLEINPVDAAFYCFHLTTWCPRLKSFSGMSLEQYEPSCSLLAKMTRLEELALCFRDAGIHNYNYLKELTSPLKKLDVYLAVGTFYMDTLLQSIHHLPVEELRVTILRNELTLTQSLGAENSTIRSFHLRCGTKSFISLNFLQSLKKVEYIEFSHDTRDPFMCTNTLIPSHPKGTPENIRFYQYYYQEGAVWGEKNWHTKMYESNIWEVVPSLKTLHVHGGRWKGIFIRFNSKYFRRVYEEKKVKSCEKSLAKISLKK